MRLGFRSFLTAHNLSRDSIRYSDYVMARLLFEATRDAGFWNLHWNITDQPPNSDRIWQRWKSAGRPSVLKPTATAECDELSALYAFLAERAGLRSVGLLWPYPNHTVAVWILRPTTSPVIRVVVPTSQIFLTESATFDTKKFNPWRQKNIYEYTRRDVADSFEFPKPLFHFFLHQVGQVCWGIGRHPTAPALSPGGRLPQNLDSRASRSRRPPETKRARVRPGGRSGGALQFRSGYALRTFSLNRLGSWIKDCPRTWLRNIGTSRKLLLAGNNLRTFRRPAGQLG